MAKKTPVVAEPEPDWPAVLRTGPAGVARWNARPAGARQLTRLGRGDYAGCDLTGINLHGQSVLKFQAAGANLTGADLADGSFIEADFRGADFTGAKMTKFCARDADLSGAKLPGVKLAGGRLVRAKFAGADLTDADLTGADLTGADFTDANLAGTVLAELTFDQTTTWPAGFEVPADAKWSPKSPATVSKAGIPTAPTTPSADEALGVPAAPPWSPSSPDPRFTGVGDSAVAINLEGVVARLKKVIDIKRLVRVSEMLKSGRNQLFAEIEPDSVRGVVRSQVEDKLVYSCVVARNGTYSCCTPDLAPCKGLRGELCKHALVLLIGLVKADQLDAPTADRLVVAAAGKKHQWNDAIEGLLGETLLKYKGAVAGEIDWRPTETIPEDFYAM